MLFRLVRPMKRAGSRNQYFVKRIPADLKSRGEDSRVYVPVGDEAVAYVVSRRAHGCMRGDMRLRKITIQNFRSIEKIENFRIEPLQALVGQNNAGKSNILKALDCFL